MGPVANWVTRLFKPVIEFVGFVEFIEFVELEDDN